MSGMVFARRLQLILQFRVTNQRMQILDLGGLEEAMGQIHTSEHNHLEKYNKMPVIQGRFRISVWGELRYRLQTE